MRQLTTALLALAALTPALSAQQRTSPGPVIQSGGAVFSVPSPTFATPMDQEYKAVFVLDSSAPSPDRPNQSLNTVARFLNMHAQAGLPRDQVHTAVVVHGGAVFDVLDDAGYRERNGVDNPNAELVRELLAAGTQIVLCGQSAASRQLDWDQLIPGVKVALSAMTALQVFQQDGYRLNPW